MKRKWREKRGTIDKGGEEEEEHSEAAEKRNGRK
jgi:hypothetical protein